MSAQEEWNNNGPLGTGPVIQQYTVVSTKQTHDLWSGSKTDEERDEGPRIPFEDSRMLSGP